MTIDEANAAVGRLVVYRAPHGETEQGVITGVSARFVFVRYGAQITSQATPPELLTLVVSS